MPGVNASRRSRVSTLRLSSSMVSRSWRISELRGFEAMVTPPLHERFEKRSGLSGPVRLCQAPTVGLKEVASLLIQQHRYDVAELPELGRIKRHRGPVLLGKIGSRRLCVHRVVRIGHEDCRDREADDLIE